MSSSRRWAAGALVLALVAFAGLGLARATGAGAPPTRQERVDAIAATIRCPTCQGLSIKDSPSVLAEGSRKIVQEQVAQGRTPDQVRQYFVDRYGPYVLLSPRTRGTSLLVWLVPGVALLAAGALGLRWLRRAAPPAVAGARVPDAEGDGDAGTALSAFRSGTFDPDASPAGERLREALLVRLAAADDSGGDAAAALVRSADVRLAAAYRRYLVRTARVSRPARRSPALPRRALTVTTVVALVAATGTALAVGVRTRGAGDLPTGDLPGGVAAEAAPSPEPGLVELQAATQAKPDDPTAWVALGRAYEASDALAKALAAYDTALRLRAGADDVALLRAGVLFRAGSGREALPDLVGLAARQPADPDTVLLLGLVQHDLREPAARATLQRYLALAPDAPQATAVRSLLKRP